MVKTQNSISVKLNYIYSVAYQMLLIVTPIITAPILSRRLGPDMIGQQSYCYSIATYFVLFIMLGVTNYGNRCVARVRENRERLSQTFWTIYGFQAIRAVVVLLLYLIFIFIFEQKYFLISFINALYVFSALFDISWLFFGLEQFKLTVPVNFVLKLVNILLIIIFIKEPTDIWKYALIIGMVTTLSNIILWLYLKRFVDWYKPTFSEFIPHIKPELILFIPVIAVSLYKVMDRIMLGEMSPSSQVGFYTQAESIVNIPMGLITSLGTVMLPRISNLISKGDKESSKRYIENSMTFALMMAFAMMFGLSAIAPTFSITFFGENYAPCGSIIIGLSITIIFISWANIIRTQYLIPNSRDKSFLVSIIIGAVINLCVNYLLIPKYYAMGAVVGTVCAEATVCLVQTFIVRRELPISKYLFEVLPFGLMGLVMFLFVRGVTPLIINPYVQLVVQIFIGVGIYGAMLIGYSYISTSFVATTIQYILKNMLIKIVRRK